MWSITKKKACSITKAIIFKSLSLDSRENPEDLLMENPDETPVVLPAYIDAEDFVSVMQNMKYRWVQINRGGPEKVEGVLVDANETEVTLVVGNEVVRVMPFHIRNISYGIKKKEQEKEQEKEQGNKQSEGKESNNEKDGQKDKDKDKDSDKKNSEHKEKEKGDHKEKGDRKEKGNHRREE